MKCPEGFKIETTSLFVGRKDKKTCPSSRALNPNCVYPIAPVRQRCDSQQSCKFKIAIGPGALYSKDYCPGSSFYAETEYKCVSSGFNQCGKLTVCKVDADKKNLVWSYRDDTKDAATSAIKINKAIDCLNACQQLANCLYATYREKNNDCKLTSTCKKIDNPAKNVAPTDGIFCKDSVPTPAPSAAPSTRPTTTPSKTPTDKPTAAPISVSTDCLIGDGGKFCDDEPALNQKWEKGTRYGITSQQACHNHCLNWQGGGMCKYYLFAADNQGDCLLYRTCKKKGNYDCPTCKTPARVFKLMCARDNEFPTVPPTDVPTLGPSLSPSLVPSFSPSASPTILPSNAPWAPSQAPRITPAPTPVPTVKPTMDPTQTPSLFPTHTPSVSPAEGDHMKTAGETFVPTNNPSSSPTFTPTDSPQFKPRPGQTHRPTAQPSSVPSDKPSNPPTSPPKKPTGTPTLKACADEKIVAGYYCADAPALNKDAKEIKRKGFSTTKSCHDACKVWGGGSLCKFYTYAQDNQGECLLYATCNQKKLYDCPKCPRPATTWEMCRATAPPFTRVPSEAPTTGAPTDEPTANPTGTPTVPPTKATAMPSALPQAAPQTPDPTLQPSAAPTSTPTLSPAEGDRMKKAGATPAPTAAPSVAPTLGPSTHPPTQKPLPTTTTPTLVPTFNPTLAPSAEPTNSPSLSPTLAPTYNWKQYKQNGTYPPTLHPSVPPTATPTHKPTAVPTLTPTLQPTLGPSPPPNVKTPTPTYWPTLYPSRSPTVTPSELPTYTPTKTPTLMPTPNTWFWWIG
jgi:hypothetical protein